MRRFAVFALALLVSLQARAASAPVGDTFAPTDTGINGALLSASPTMTLKINNFNALTVIVAHTYAASSAVNMVCKAGTSALVAAPVGIANVSSTGAIVMADASWSYPTTGASRSYRMIVAPLNDKIIVCTFSGAGVTTDTIKVSAYAGDN